MENGLENEMYDYLKSLGYEIKNLKKRKEIIKEINIFLKLCLFRYDKYYTLFEIFGNFVQYYNIEPFTLIEYIDDEVLRNYIKSELSKLK